MENLDVIRVLNEDVQIKGVSIKESEMFKTLSDMNVSEQYINDYSNSLHNLLKVKGIDEAEKKVLTIFRINPLVAIRIIESCSIVKDIDQLSFAIKPVFSVIREGGGCYYRDLSFEKMVLNNKVSFVTLLIEAVYQKSMIATNWQPRDFLKYAQEQDQKLHKQGRKPKFLNAYNIKHIFSHIPDNRQIELVNWFWDKHCYSAKEFYKKESFAGTRVHIMLSILPEGAMWQHLENASMQQLSKREQDSLTNELEEIKHFVEAVFAEGRHLQYIKQILGNENFYDKLTQLMGNDYNRAKYDRAVLQQKQWDEEDEAQQQKKLEEERRERENAEYEKLFAEQLKKRKIDFQQLINRVKNKYDREKNELEWHNVNPQIEDDQISLWSYFQGANFLDVNVMVLGYDWGCVKEKSYEMRKCLKKIKSMKNGTKKVRYYSCKDRKLDYSLVWLFKNCFGRDIRDNKYSDLFFSEACLGYKLKPDTLVTKEMAYDDISDFLIDELEVIQPKTIFCMGDAVFNVIVQFFENEQLSSIKEHKGVGNIVAKEIIIGDKTIVLYLLPHCGVDGLKEVSLQNQLGIWNEIKEDMKKMNVIL